jgi:hypothetical protein
MKVSKSYNLKVLFPGLAKEWHLRKNGDLTPEDVTHCTQKKVWWRCPKGHQWQASIYLRVKGSGCPHCNGRRVTQSYNLQKLKAWLSKQWHPTKNGNLTPRDVTPYSNKKVWWKCKKGHEYEMMIGQRSRGRGCPSCFERKLPENAFKKGHVPKSFKGFFTPRIKNWDDRSRVVTTLEEKLKTKGKKGK